MKKRVLLFARSFLCEYYGKIKTEVFEPIFVTMTTAEKKSLQVLGWKVYGCFEEQYSDLSVASFSGDYLKTSLVSDRFLSRYPHEKRLEILGKEISFWRMVFEETKPDMLVNETVAIEMAEVMAIEAQSRNIPFYTSLLGFLPNTFYWKPDPFSGRLNDLTDVIPSESDCQVARDYINGVVEKNTRPFYVANIKKHSFSLKTLLHAYQINVEAKRKQRKLETESYFRYEDYSIFAEKGLEICRSVRHFKYDTIKSIEGKNVLFYPMHLEPEATLNYFVDENYDQASLIRMILCCMKNNQYLVVKEHPQQQGALSLEKFSELKKTYSNLIYLPSYESSFEVLKRTDAVVTLTSTVGWEALMLGVPVFVLGKIFYDQCHGATRISGLKELKMELQKAEYTKPNTSETLSFAAKMVSLFHKGCPGPGHVETIVDYCSEIEQLAIQ